MNSRFGLSIVIGVCVAGGAALVACGTSSESSGAGGDAQVAATHQALQELPAAFPGSRVSATHWTTSFIPAPPGPTHSSWGRTVSRAGLGPSLDE